MILDLPWPPSALSPNARVHWAVLSKHKNQQRTLARNVVKQAMRSQLLPEGDLHMMMLFFPPNKRRHDRDNLLARSKAAIDGMCDALGIDDYRIVSVEVRTAHVPDKDNPRISVMLVSASDTDNKPK